MSWANRLSFRRDFPGWFLGTALAAGCVETLPVDVGPDVEETDSDEGTTNLATCGDGILEDGEECDDGINDGRCGGCTADCVSAEACVGEFERVSAGYYHTCGVKTDGTIVCWGYNELGQSTPPSGTFTDVGPGYLVTCGVKTDGTIACSGDDNSGLPTPPSGTFIDISGGISHMCGRKTDATVACWGDDEVGQSDPPSGTFTDVSAGGAHTCGVETDGTIACWGLYVQ